MQCQVGLKISVRSAKRTQGRNEGEVEKEQAERRDVDRWRDGKSAGWDMLEEYVTAGKGVIKY